MKLYIIWNHNYRFKSPEYFKTLKNFIPTNGTLLLICDKKPHEPDESAAMATGSGGKIQEYHRMTKCLKLKGPLEVSHPTLLLKQGHLEHSAQDCVQLAFTSLQGWRVPWATCASAWSH